MELEQMANELGFTLPGLFQTAYRQQPKGHIAGNRPDEDYQVYRRQKVVPPYVVTFLERLGGH